MKLSKSRSIADEISHYVVSKIAFLKGIEEQGAGKGMLAELRRGLGKSPGEMPELWGLIFDVMPEELLGMNRMSYAEWTVYTVLTLYALHCQGADYEVNTQGQKLGVAAAKLVESEDDIQRVTNRFHLVVTSTTLEELSYHMRGMIQLLKAKNIALDYASLSKDLYLFNISDAADTVKLNWGRDFYREIYKKTGGK